MRYYLDTDKYDERVEGFLEEKKIQGPLFIIAVDKDGKPHAFGARLEKGGPAFVRIWNEGQEVPETPAPRGDCAYWIVLNSGEATVGGTKYVW
jgi:hypothetical protein